uniref:maturase K n=1 Tax=Muellerina eucalyptoides TaxID=286086 RepID=UPI002A80CCFD|nr:maturase K [Muellerina eucalyptoides]WNR57517.1 maturase K [Muellerina eucalyptoides]WNR57582.1 maturase K [Muellerina eucalyptoides]WNR57647.1 maturase K [Muellerina eucalyptoides]
MEEFKKNVDQDRTRKQGFFFFYPLFFQEYIYALPHNRSFNRSSLVENVGYDTKVRLLIVKRLITQMYQQNYFLISTTDSNQNTFWGHNKHFYLQIMSGKLAVIVKIKFCLHLLSSREDNKIDESKNLRSIHSLFPFLEDKFSHLNYVSNRLIPYPVHLEILVLILRCSLKDASSLHFLRFVFHENRNRNLFFLQKKYISTFSKRNQGFFLFLYNSHVCESESIFVFLRNQSYHLRSTFFGTLFERNFLYRKIKKEHLVNVFTKDFQAISWLFKDIFIHYVRYQGKSILAAKRTSLILNKWNYYLDLFWKCRFYVWYQPERRINKLSKHFLYFLGYLSSSNIRFNPSLGRSQMLENAFLINNIIKTLDTTVPILPLVGSLSKAKVDDVLDHPISKWISSDLSDYDIIDLFWYICRTISHYYSGASKKTSLYQIKYILRLSCTRTLARKHKSALRAFLKRLGPEFLEEFFTEEEQVLSLIFSRYSFTSRRLYRKGRIWYLDIICINDLFSHS